MNDIARSGDIFGPRTKFGQTIHAAKYRAPDERYDDYAVRWSRAVSENDRQFRRSLRYARGQEILPAGRQQHSMGRPYQTTAMNCLRSDVEILTDTGFQKVGNLAGRRIMVLSPVTGQFEVAVGKNYGRQQLNKIVISTTSRDDPRSETFSVYATAAHRWVLRNGNITEDLRIGDLLRAGYGAIDSDPRGWVHGFIYGDGSKIRDEVPGALRSNPLYADEYPKKKFQIRLCGNKRRHINRFFEVSEYGARATYPPSAKGDPFIVVFSDDDLKHIPIDRSPEYVRGFVEGLLAADGGVDNRGRCYFHGSKKIVLWMRDHMVLAGYAPSGAARESGGEATNFGERTEPLWEQAFYPSERHSGFRVVAIEPGPIEEVFCVEEPRHQQITLRDGLATGNCFVGGAIPDSFEGIMDALKWGGMTLRTGGGCGWDFSTLRPGGEPIRGLGPGSFASGPVSFMTLWDATCATILTAGHRRGAMMSVLRVDHPDILNFVGAKRATGQLKNFNISVAVSDTFMEALDHDGLYDLQFGGTKFASVRAVDVWSRIMESNWDWAEPGVLFMDRINQRNPLYYCEQIAATNPCGEQPLPPYGTCLLGSINVVKMLFPARVSELAPTHVVDPLSGRYDIDYELLDDVVDTAVRAFDNVLDRTNYPLPQQREEALNKRRMGLGVTGMANALEIMGHRYGSPSYIAAQDKILHRIAYCAYRTSIDLAKEKGPFPLFDAEKYCAGWFVQNVMKDLEDDIRQYGIRNGLLLSIAPTGTISMAADNISSGIEPPYALYGRYDIHMPDGKQTFDTIDHALEFYGVECQTALQTTGEQHVDVACAAQKWIDSNISKTCNVKGQVGGKGEGIPFSNFTGLYMRAYVGGAKGCTLFNESGKLVGVRHDASDDRLPEIDTGSACYFDSETGKRSCDE